MKIQIPEALWNGRRGERAATLAEMVITMAVFVMAMGGMFQLHMFGMLQDQVSSSKLGASDSSRQAFNALLKEIRSAKSYRIGTASSATTTNVTFTPIAFGTNQQGNALRIYQNNNTNQYITYYFRPNNGTNEVRRTTNGWSGSDVITRNLNNTNIIFRAEDYAGGILTALDNHTVVGVWLEYYEFRYPKTKVGTNYYYDYYKLEFKASSRNYD